jgi:uncharacterized protein YlxW (UPF0749 family)
MATSRRSSKTLGVNFAVIAASVVLGFMLTVQFRSTAARLPVREQSRLATAETVKRLEDEQHSLKDRITQLRVQIVSLQQATDAKTVTADLDQQRLLAGLIAVRGPGVLVTLDDSPKIIGPADDANNYIIHDYELRDVISLLWLAGAEAVSVNGERVVSISSLYCVGSTILVNDTRLSPPYEIRAIGESESLEQAVQNPKNLAKLRARVKTYGIQFKTAPQRETAIPAFGGNLHIRYARPTVTPDNDDGSRAREMP